VDSLLASKSRSSRNWIKESASNLSSGFFSNQLQEAVNSLQIAEIDIAIYSPSRCSQLAMSGLLWGGKSP
jgi:hypothetical protein